MLICLTLIVIELIPEGSFLKGIHIVINFIPILEEFLPRIVQPDSIYFLVQLFEEKLEVVIDVSYMQSDIVFQGFSQYENVIPVVPRSHDLFDPSLLRVKAYAVHSIAVAARIHFLKLICVIEQEHFGSKYVVIVEMGIF